MSGVRSGALSTFVTRVVLVGVSLIALGAFAWPFVSASIFMFAVVPVLLVIAALTLDSSIRTGTTVAMLGVLTAVATALRLMSTGFGGFELVFTIVILSGAAYGARFGFLLGVTTILASSLLWGGVGPWTAFQAFALGWVGAGAGFVSRVNRRIPALAIYGAISSYLFGALMNLWFWPIAVGPETDISYVSGAPLAENATRFLGYTLVTSTLTWDTVRGITTVVGIVATGAMVLRALNRAPISRATTKPRSTSPQGDGTQTRQSTVRDVTATLPKDRRQSAQV